MKSQSAIAYEKIKEMIFHLELMPGSKLSEPLLSERLSISRTPIHDALRRLAGEGLVIIGRNVGATVASFTENEIQEIGIVRLSQDILSANLAAYCGSVIDFNRLEEMAKNCEKAAADGDIYSRIRADLDFHLEISKVSGNQYLYRKQYELYQQVHLIQIIQYTGVEDSLTQISYHIPLVQAIRSCNLEEIKRLSCEHLQEFFHLDAHIMEFYGYKGE